MASSASRTIAAPASPPSEHPELPARGGRVAATSPPRRRARSRGGARPRRPRGRPRPAADARGQDGAQRRRPRHPLALERSLRPARLAEAAARSPRARARRATRARCARVAKCVSTRMSCTLEQMAPPEPLGVARAGGPTRARRRPRRARPRSPRAWLASAGPGSASSTTAPSTRGCDGARPRRRRPRATPRSGGSRAGSPPCRGRRAARRRRGARVVRALTSRRSPRYASA